MGRDPLTNEPRPNTSRPPPPPNSSSEAKARALTDIYGADLARAHHEGFGDVARGAAATLLAALGPTAGPTGGPFGGLVVDLGAGSGILARLLTDAGYRVLGFDLSGDMVRLARSHAPAARFVRAALLDADIPPCVAVTAVGEVLNYAFDPRTGAEHLVPLFRRGAASLLPGGLVLFDVAGPGRAGPTGRREGSADGDGWTIRFVTEEDADSSTVVRTITLVSRDGDADRRHDERHVLRLYRPDDVEEALLAAGLGDVRRLVRYGDFDLPTGLTGFLAALSPGRPRTGRR